MNFTLVYPIALGWLVGVFINYLSEVLPHTRRFSQPLCRDCQAPFSWIDYLAIAELLPGFYDDWVILERERLQTLFESKMEQLVEKLVDAERWTAIQEQCERWLVLGHSSEPAYRALMLSYNARGDMAMVSSVYQRCVEDLRDHLGVEPSAETHALFNGLLKGAKVPRRVTTG